MFSINKSFAPTADDKGKGFHMTFANGWTVSVQFGEGNYCTGMMENNVGGWSANTAEVCAWDSSGIYYSGFPNSATADGWKSPEEVADFISMVKGF